jgi:hypothetical protein
MLEQVAIPVTVALLTKLGGKLIDKFWGEASAGNTAVIKQDGSVGIAASHDGRTLISKEYTAARSVAQPSHIIGNFYIPTSIHELLTGEEIALVLVIEETTLQPYLFVADLNAGYEIYLPAGVYSFYVFLMDTTAEEFFDAEIYAVGFPSRIDLSRVGEITVDELDNIWEIVGDEPLEIKNRLESILDFILIDTEQIPGFPQRFGDLFEDDTEQLYDLTGIWQLEEEYEFGTAMAELYLVQTGASMSGMMVRQDLMDDGTESVVQEFVSGKIEGSNISLYGTSYRVIYGELASYNLDLWVGLITHDETIAGLSEDEAGAKGAFVLRRISVA